MTSLAEATREELKQALAVLDDPYKPYKDALKAGKRVRINGSAWYGSLSSFNWNADPKLYEIEPDKPELCCDHAPEQSTVHKPTANADKKGWPSEDGNGGGHPTTAPTYSF